jgi:hypothetical protein
MDLRNEEKAEARFRTHVEGLASVLEHADRTGPLRDYCTRDPGTDGSEDGSGADGGAAPVVAAFCRCRVLVGREGAGQGARDGATRN